MTSWKNKSLLGLLLLTITSCTYPYPGGPGKTKYKSRDWKILQAEYNKKY